MPIYIHPANLISAKKSVDNRYEGGIFQFRLDYIKPTQQYNQEDNELFAIARLNVDELPVEELIDKGLHFDNELQYSNDFVIRPRYGDYFWKAEWITDNNVFAWDKDADASLIFKAEEIAMTPLNKIEELIEIGKNPFQTII